MTTYSLNNYFLINGQEVKAREIHQDNTLTVSYKDGSLIRVPEKTLRYIELGSNVLLRLQSEEDSSLMGKLLKTSTYEFHKKEDYSLSVRGSMFFISGFLYEDKSIWYFSNTFTVHYVHQLQNLISIIHPGFVVQLRESI